MQLRLQKLERMKYRQTCSWSSPWRELPARPSAARPPPLDYCLVLGPASSFRHGNSRSSHFCTALSLSLRPPPSATGKEAEEEEAAIRSGRATFPQLRASRLSPPPTAALPPPTVRRTQANSLSSSNCYRERTSSASQTASICCFARLGYSGQSFPRRN